MTQASASPRDLAVAAAASLQPGATGLVALRSEGRLLVIGRQRHIASVRPRLDERLSAQFVTTDSQPATQGSTDYVLSGHIGAFKLLPASGSGGTPGEFDLVLDLCDPALFTMPQKPIGYFAPGTSETALTNALTALPDLIGRFEKPQFFAYDPSICAHAASGIEGCRQCLDACPTAAIISIGERVEVDPQLCQGGGICATVCPTGAMTYRYPGVSDTLARVRESIHTYADAAEAAPVIVFHAIAMALPDLRDNEIPMALEELASVGVETWLGALAYGAARVDLLADDTAPSTVHEPLARQIALANELLGGLEFPPAVRWYGSDRTEASETMPPIDPASYAASGEKRQNLYLAIDHLVTQAPYHVDAIPLASGSPLGRIIVDRQACTLCLACTSVCPAKALSDGGDTPALRLFEANCVQCGICAAACPENAIELEARLICDPNQRRAPVTLHEEQPFRCISCGKPFATKSVIEKMQSSLADHWMFKDETARNRLSMCEDCRVADMMRHGEFDRMP